MAFLLYGRPRCTRGEIAMFTFAWLKRAGLLVLPLIAIGFMANLTSAAKPGSGGGSSTGGGTIYFQSGPVLIAMNSDGSGKTALPPNVKGTPSRLLHGGHRWFLANREV